jgi:hypothetical protein
MSCVPLLLVVVPGNSIKNRTSRSRPGQRRNGQLPVTFGTHPNGYPALRRLNAPWNLDDCIFASVVEAFASVMLRIAVWCCF